MTAMLRRYVLLCQTTGACRLVAGGGRCSRELSRDHWNLHVEQAPPPRPIPIVLPSVTLNPRNTMYRAFSAVHVSFAEIALYERHRLFYLTSISSLFLSPRGLFRV